MKAIVVLLVSTLFGLRAIAGSIPTTIQFETLPGTPGNAPGNNLNGTENGYVGGYIGGATVLSQVICDDFYDHTNVPSDPIPYYVTSINDVGMAGSNTLYSSESDYEAAAILANDILGLTGTDSVTENYVALDQYAIWNLMTPSTPVFSANGTTSTIVAQSALTQADADPSDPLYSNFLIYTPQVIGSDQEYMGPAPEPSSVFLFLAGAAFLGLGAARSRVLRAKG